MRAQLAAGLWLLAQVAGSVVGDTAPALRGSTNAAVDIANQTAAEVDPANQTGAADKGNSTGPSDPDSDFDTVSSQALDVPAFFWNVHWQCSVGAQGSSGACKDRAARAFVQLARSTNAQLVASVELSHGMSTPVDLPSYGLQGWTQVSGPCTRGGNGDSAALAFAPGWQVLGSGGGCLRHDYDTRAFAVARVRPPAAVQGCDSLCVVAIHAPHTDITTGRDVVANVCGSTVQQCAVAMGDWNVGAEEVGRLWSALIGGNTPRVAMPNERTCCFPESRHYGVYDHIATNVVGSGHGPFTVHPYQILAENPVEQHRPVSARLFLPGAN